MLAVLPAIAHAQPRDYPQRPVRVVVNLTAGGGVDAVARIAGQHMSALWGQPFVVDNRPGAGGSIGVELVTKATPDGYTLLVASSGVATNAAVRPQGYDPVRDLQAVSKMTSNPYIVLLTPSLPASNIKEFIALAKAKPNGLSYASSGVGGILHLTAELLAIASGAPMVHVPYKGVAEAYPAVASGLVNWLIGSPISALPLMRAGRLKGIAVTSGVRSKMMPEIPTVAESGIPGYDVVAWYGMFAPAKTPMTIVSRLQAETKRSLNTPEVAKRMEVEATDIVGNTPQAFAAEVKAEYDKWRAVVKKAGIGANG